MRQRNVPDHPKVSTLVQTDINLITPPLVYNSDLHLTHLSPHDTASYLIRSHTDAQLLDFFKQEASFFRGLGSLENVSQQELRKRLLWIERQIEGLEKRKLTVEGLGHADYYAILSDVQGKLDRQLVINNNYEPKLRQAQIKIDELEREIEELRRTVTQQNFYKTQNEMYEEAFKKISDITKDQRKMRELEKTVNDLILPMINEYDVKLDSMMKTISNMGRSSNDPKYKLKGQISGLLRNLDKLIRSTGEMTLQNVQKYISQFLKQLQISETYQNYENRKSYKHRYLQLQQRFNTSLSMLKNKFQVLLQQNPALAGQLDFSVFEILQREGVSFYNFDRIVTVEISDPKVRRVEKQVMDERSKEYLKLLVSQFRHVIKLFPLIREHLSQQLLQIVNLEIFQDAIDTEQINRIFQVVKYKPQLIKVQNIYTYNNETHLKTIFHLKILIKSLLDELLKLKQRTNSTLQIDEGLFNMIKLEILDYVNPNDVLRVFRTLPKILEVEKIVERNLSRYQGILTEGHPIIVESVKVAESIIEKPVIIKEQVGVIVEKGIPLVAIHEKPIELITDRIVEVAVEREVLVERVVLDERIIQVDILKQCPIIKQELKYIQIPTPQQIIVQVPTPIRQQIPIITRQIIRQVVQVQKFHQRLVQVVKQITSLKQVKMIQQVPVEITKYMQVEKIINNFVPVQQIIEVKEQVPITVTTIIEKPIQVIETVEKIVQVKTVEERLVEVEVLREVAVIQEVPKPYKEIEEVYIKGDKEEIIVEIQKIIEKPIIHQILKVVQIQREKIVPLIIQQDRPIIVQLKQPYIQNQIQIVTCEIQKVVPYRQEVPIEILKEIPVAVVCEKEVIKPQRIIVQKIIEKIVEVPRVVEVERIVEKIVVVPRVIQNIVLVPQIIQRIVQREVQVLKIIEIQKPVPYYIYKQVPQIIQQRIQIPIEKTNYTIVEKEKMVVVNTQTEVLKEVEVERRVPYEVVREKEVLMVREKIVEKIVEINNVEIKEKEVVVPFRHEVPIELIRQKGVQIKKIIDNIIQVPQIITRNNILYQTITIPQIHQIIIQKPIQIIKQVIYTNVNNHIEIKPQYKEIIRQVLVKETEKLEILKPEPYYIEKIVVVTNVEEQAVEVRVEKGVPYRVDNVIVVDKPVPVQVVQEVPKIVNVEKVVELRTIHETIKEVPIEGREKTVVLETVKPQIVQITKQVIKVLIEHQQKNILQQVALIQQNTQIVDVPTRPLVVHEVKQIYRENYEPLLLEKVIERVTLLPQIVEVLKHIHEITEERIDGLGLGIVGGNVDIEVHTSNYVELCRNLKKGLENLMGSLRNAKSPEVKAQVTLIQELVLVLNDLIRFPNIIQIPKLVEKIVEVNKPIVVPTRDNQSIVREIAANTLIEKLLVELKRVRGNGIEIKLDSDILNTFFIDLKTVQNLSQKIDNIGSSLINKFKTLGEWTNENTIMLNNFLQEKFLLSNIVRESNRSIERLKEKLEMAEGNRVKLDEAVTKLNISNMGLKNTLDQVVEGLNRSRRSQVVDRDEINGILKRVSTTISQFDSQEVNTLPNNRQSIYQDTNLRRKVSEMERELESYRGGEIQRSRYVNDQNIDLKNEVQTSKLEISRLKTLLNEINLGENSRERVVSSSRVEDLNNLLTEQKMEYDRAVQKLREEFLKREAERSVETRVITSTIDRSEQEEKQRQIIVKLQLRIRDLENELANARNRESRVAIDLERKGIEFEDLRRKFTERETRISELDRTTSHHAEDDRLRFTVSDLESKIRELKEQLGRSTTDLIKSNDNASKFRNNLQKSQFEQSRLMTELKKKSEQVQGMRSKLAESHYKTAQKGSSFTERKPGIEDQFTSAEIRHVTPGNNPDTHPPHFGTPNVHEFQFSESSGTEKKDPANIEYKNVILNELMEQRSVVDENVSSKIVVKICEKLQSNIMMKLYLFYTPSNIKLIDYSIDDLDKMTVEFGAPIKIKDATEADKKYLPPESLRGAQLSEKSCIFNIGIIWDEMLHGETFYKDSEEILEQNSNFQSYLVEYKVRNIRMNPIFKNALFEMIHREPSKRQGFAEIMRRLSLQKYITTDIKRKS